MSKRPRIWILLLAVFIIAPPSSAQDTGVRAVVVNEYANIRIAPALGADVIDTVSAGFEFNVVTARSADNEWIRVLYAGNEGWVNLAPLVVLSGNVSALPVADPRSIPYGGFEAPRAGPSNAVGPLQARATNGVRMRAGPSRAYPELDNIFYNTLVTVTGRTAGNTHFQVSYNGQLGWVSGLYLQFEGPGDINILPIDGLVADRPPFSTKGTDDYVGQLKFMRERLDLAQPSLDAIRAAWTDAALTGRARCSPYPARPSDLSIAVPLLAANYPVLEPLQRQFNDAMFNVRKAIDLFIEICNLPGTGNPVGTATVQGALDTIALADSQFAGLRARLNELIPPDLAPGANECLLTYNGRSQILPVITQTTIYLETMDARKTTTGYCIDFLEGQVLLFDSLQLGNSNIQLFFALSPFDNPTAFVATGVAAGPKLAVSPIRITKTGRYLLILNHIGTAVPNGDFAFVVLDITTSTINPTLSYDAATGQVSVIVPTTGGDASGTGGGQETNATQEAPSVTCPSLAFTCSQLFTCSEAQACLAAGNFSLDPDSDGIPCEESLCGP